MDSGEEGDGSSFDVDAFGADLKRAIERSEAVSENMGDAAGVVTDIVSVSERNNLVLPQEFGLLTKQVVYLNRYTSTLAPGLDLFSEDMMARMGPPPGMEAEAPEASP